VSDVGTLDNGTPFIVMELLEGTDLARTLTTSGPLPVARACSYVLQACLGVSEAHVLGIIHRDLKPANLFLTHRPDGTVRAGLGQAAVPCAEHHRARDPRDR
jgi:serine/threonine-protein kinase